MDKQLFLERVEEVSPFMREHLPEFVSHYKEVIGSKRRCSSIADFEELVRILIKRDKLDPRDRSTWDEFNSVCKLYARRPFAEPVVAANGRIEPTILCVEPKVVSYLSSRISFSWRNFARGLNVPENDIKEIESRCGANHSNCVKEVLYVYEKNMAWASESRGNAIDDIYRALAPLQRGFLLDEFARLTGTSRR